MRRPDLTPLYKTTIGFDHLASILDQLSSLDAENGFPPYNIERLGENSYRISMAVAGFGDNDLSLEVKEGTLTIRGEKKGEDKVRQYIHQGIAARNFERRFRLAEYVEVSGATLEHGLLHIDLKRELPEAMKPRTIQIAKGTPLRPARDRRREQGSPRPLGAHASALEGGRKSALFASGALEQSRNLHMRREPELVERGQAREAEAAASQDRGIAGKACRIA